MRVVLEVVEVFVEFLEDNREVVFNLCLIMIMDRGKFYELRCVVVEVIFEVFVNFLFMEFVIVWYF